MKLSLDAKQCKHYVRVVVGNYHPNRLRVEACFVSRKLRKDGLMGTVYLRPGAALPIVVHELTHAAMHFVEHFTDMEKYNKLNESEQYAYFTEACAYSVEWLLENYIKETSK